ncbi:MAG: EcsC family protein, partial [Bdellovibrionota bacterium]
RMLNKAAPAQLMARIAAEFKIVVTEKMILESLPVVGAIGGAVINAAFSNYFNKAAHYHFGIKTLERRYGAEQVSAAYTKLLK